ncbi:GNAT family N-acetyltransferase [Fructilactobacillus fructivorans]|nr:GNAT family protein [Fructilactobacillus fructivorans]KRK58160.1 acetyltransferase [Fructilactobacillus fructivorans]KRN13006.1 acetyltransferase [Fructilactobacillus fructivorans]KRN41393.1 acetyltransferase [Fructilactobacillus fructivorans]KRN42565.1 acetyltransferase [Fructilactobacillus fructivorans]
MFPYQVDQEISLRLPDQAGDSRHLYQLVNNSRTTIARWLPWANSMRSVKSEQQFLTQTMAYYRAGDSVNLLIIYRDQIAGMISFNSFDVNQKQGEMGYWLGNQYTGNGIVHRAVLSMCQIGFYDYHLNQIHIKAVVDNDRSNQVAKRAGFHLNQVIQDGILINGVGYQTNDWIMKKVNYKAHQSIKV